MNKNMNNTNNSANNTSNGTPSSPLPKTDFDYRNGAQTPTYRKPTPPPPPTKKEK